MVLAMESAINFEPSSETERDSYIDSVVKEIEETGEPREIVSECNGGTIIETVEPVFLSEEGGGKIELLCTTKIEFVSEDGKIKVNFNDFVKNEKNVFEII